MQYNEIPKNILLVISIPRSGSHWLVNSLCAHPKINFYPSYIIYSYLGLTRNRYANDMRVNENMEPSLSLEYRPNTWGKIKDYTINGIGEFSSRISFYIENAHPHFFENDLIASKRMKSLCDVARRKFPSNFSILLLNTRWKSWREKAVCCTGPMDSPPSSAGLWSWSSGRSSDLRIHTRPNGDHFFKVSPSFLPFMRRSTQKNRR